MKAAKEKKAAVSKECFNISHSKAKDQACSESRTETLKEVLTALSAAQEIYFKSNQKYAKDLEEMKKAEFDPSTMIPGGKLNLTWKYSPGGAEAGYIARISVPGFSEKCAQPFGSAEKGGIPYSGQIICDQGSPLLQ